MAFTEFLKNFPLVSDLIEHHRVNAREHEIAEELYQQWWVSGEIEFSPLLRQLERYEEQEGLDGDRIFKYLSRMCNPTGSV